MPAAVPMRKIRWILISGVSPRGSEEKGSELSSHKGEKRKTKVNLHLIRSLVSMDSLPINWVSGRV